MYKNIDTAPNPPIPHDYRGTLKYRLQTHREDQAVSNYPT